MDSVLFHTVPLKIIIYWKKLFFHPQNIPNSNAILKALLSN